jgi:RecB family exonuclease
VDFAVACATLHHEQVAPALEPVAVERKFHVELPGPFDLAGTIDVQEQARLRDTKTTAKSPSEDAADKSLQLTVYHYALSREGTAVESVHLDYLVRGAKTRKVVPLKSTRGTVDHERLLRLVDLAGRQIQSGIFLPCDPSAWCCSPRWCGYWDRCPFGARGTVSVQAPEVDW